MYYPADVSSVGVTLIQVSVSDFVTRSVSKDQNKTFNKWFDWFTTIFKVQQFVYVTMSVKKHCKSSIALVGKYKDKIRVLDAREFKWYQRVEYFDKYK